MDRSQGNIFYRPGSKRSNVTHSTHLNKAIIGYEPGESSAEGCVIVEIHMPSIPLQSFIDVQYLDSKTMSQRPGMILKYLPVLYDELNGRLLSGGAYLFETYDDARGYVQWAGEDFEVGEPKVNFTKQPAFELFEGKAWEVLGAHSFLPIDEHVVTRLMKWHVGEDAGLTTKLRDVYHLLLATAEGERNVASVWLLHDPDTGSVGLQTGFKKVGGTDEAGARRTLQTARAFNVLETMLSSALSLEPSFDRTSLLLTLWLPKSRAAGGAELTIPYYPLVPDISHEHT
ncbi:hypothetical protein CC79DRAFT_1391782 [Sarocladium strictum]